MFVVFVVSRPEAAVPHTLVLVSLALRLARNANNLSRGFAPCSSREGFPSLESFPTTSARSRNVSAPEISSTFPFASPREGFPSTRPSVRSRNVSAPEISSTFLSQHLEKVSPLLGLQLDLSQYLEKVSPLLGIPLDLGTFPLARPPLIPSHIYLFLSSYRYIFAYVRVTRYIPNSIRLATTFEPKPA